MKVIIEDVDAYTFQRCLYFNITRCKPETADVGKYKDMLGEIEDAIHFRLLEMIERKE